VSDTLLEVRDLTVHHGQLRAVDGVSFQVARGEVLTMVRTIAGLHHQTSGTISFKGVKVTKLAPERRVRMGISLVPEGRRLFPSLTLEENLQVGAHRATKGTFTIDRIYELFEWMPERRRQRAWQFSGGEQQAIAIGRALVANPQVLLLDELSLGLAPIVIERIYALIPEIVAQGVGILLVEQDVTLGVGVANRVHCLLEGKTSLVGTPAELSAQQIERAYFGAEMSSPPHPQEEHS
jgi:branched-chain amino acid transport system ATP-binding protein